MKLGLYVLAAGMFTMGCDDYIVAGLLPGIAASMNTSLIGASQGLPAFGLAYVFGAPLFAVMLAGQPARRVMTLALLVFVVGNVLTLLSGSLPAYLGSRVIAGLGAGMFLPVAVAAAAALAEPEARGRAMGLIWSANSAGAVVGVPVGLALSATITWKATIGLILALSAITLLGVVTLLRTLDAEAPARPSHREQLGLLADRRVMGVIGVTCLTATGSLGLYALAASFQAGGTNPLEAALTAWNVGGLVGSMAIGAAVDRWGNPRAVMAGILAVLALALAALPVVGQVPVLGLVPFLVWGAMGWATVTPQQMVLLDLQPEQKTTVVALNSSAYGLGSIMGSAMGGLALAGGLDGRTLPYAAGLLVLTALACQLAMLRAPTAPAAPLQEAA